MTGVAERLQVAKTLLARGWCQGRPGRVTPDGREYCIYAALNRVGLGSAVERYFGIPIENLVAWQDEPGRSHLEVLARMDTAIAEASR